MQGFNMGKYYPPDFDPTKGGLNKQQGKHPLGDRQATHHNSTRRTSLANRCRGR